MSDILAQSFTVSFNYNVHFTSGLFNIANPVVNSFLSLNRVPGIQQKILFVVDRGVIDHHPTLAQDIATYFETYPRVQPVAEILVITGGEAAKNDYKLLDQILEAINRHGIDRHSYLAAIGGGSVLDLAGMAAAIAHRGIKHIRIPTTVLAQNDSGIGVKNSINYFGKKNFIGTFAPPVVVFNDELFLTTLSQRHWRSGMAEAIKVALVKDADFFTWLEQNATALANRDLPVMNYLIKRCAALHLKHISSGDPFETGSARPLDFGHWSAHKLEQLTYYEVMHGEAVAMGIALDSMYSTLAMGFSTADADRVISLIQNLGFAITHPFMQVAQADSPLLKGLEEFREHLGGQLTITLLQGIGKGVEVHEVNTEKLMEASGLIQQKVVMASEVS